MKIGMPKNAKVAVSFKDDVFKEVCRMAVKERKTFSEMVNELCKVGILCLEESDELEPRPELTIQ